MNQTFFFNLHFYPLYIDYGISYAKPYISDTIDS